MSAKGKILVVDDEDGPRTVLKAELVNEGYEVQAASDGDDAISFVRKEKYDLVLSDIKMPRVNGFEVLKFVKENSPGTHAIMMTSFVDLKNAAESKRLGADDLIAKPYDLVDLLSKIARVLEHSRKSKPS